MKITLVWNFQSRGDSESEIMQEHCIKYFKKKYVLDIC